MARRANTTKHPALMVQGNIKAMDDIGQRDVEQLKHIPGWSAFSVDKRQFLSILPWFNSYAETSRYLGLNHANYTKWAKRDPLFKAAAHMRRGARVLLVREYAQDLLGMSMVWMRKWLDPETDTTDAHRLQVIKSLYALSDLGNEAADKVPINVTAQNVMFEGARSATPDPIEIVADDDER